MIKILTVIGARPQIIKAGALSRTIQTKFSDKIQEILLHTGQHYDETMSEIFFNELNIPKPDVNLNVGSSGHAEQTANMAIGIEKEIKKHNPQAVVLYGDTNSTLAGAIAASKIHTPVIHIEAGLRSYNKKMPEEINRLMCDHVSTLLFTPSQNGLNNLLREGFKPNPAPPYHINNPAIYVCGDIMYDNSIYFSQLCEKKTELIDNLRVEKNKFILCTIHRDTNTDDEKRLSSIFDALSEIQKKYFVDIVIPLHPRTRKLINQYKNNTIKLALQNNGIKIIEPLGFLEMTLLEKYCAMVITDSGGVQKEAYYFKKPCIILRDETEWTELTTAGAAILAGADKDKILTAYINLQHKDITSLPEFYGNGKTAEFICEKITETFTR